MDKLFSYFQGQISFIFTQISVVNSFYIISDVTKQFKMSLQRTLYPQSCEIHLIVRMNVCAIIYYIPYSI